MSTDRPLPSMYDSLRQFSGDPANFTPLTPLAYLARTADVYPDHTSLIYEEQQYTWSQTYHRCQQMAKALQSLGIESF